VDGERHNERHPRRSRDGQVHHDKTCVKHVELPSEAHIHARVSVRLEMENNQVAIKASPAKAGLSPLTLQVVIAV